MSFFSCKQFLGNVLACELRDCIKWFVWFYFCTNLSVLSLPFLGEANVFPACYLRCVCTQASVHGVPFWDCCTDNKGCKLAGTTGAPLPNAVQGDMFLWHSGLYLKVEVF